MNTEIQTTITSMVAQTTAALKDAVSTYGPDAVDLALAAYRLEAAQQLLYGFLSFSLVLVTLWLGRYIPRIALENWKHADDSDRIYINTLGLILSSLASLMPLTVTVEKSFDLSAWAALFGYPELRIVTKALEAAGLM